MLLYVAGFSNLLKDITQRSVRNSVNSSSTKEFVVYGEAALSDCNTLKNTATNTSEYIHQDFTFRGVSNNHHEVHEDNEVKKLQILHVLHGKKQPKSKMQIIVNHGDHFIITISGSDSSRQDF